MELLYFVLILGACLSCGADFSVDIKNDPKLIGLLERARANPEMSMDCFNFYIPEFNSVAKTYETSYMECLSTATKQIQDTDDSFEDAEVELQNYVSEAFKGVEGCANLAANLLQRFICYEKESSAAARKMLQASADAKTCQQNLEVEYLLLQSNQYKCTNATQIKYAQNTADIYTDLEGCLLGYNAPAATTTPRPNEPTPPPVAATTRTTTPPATHTPTSGTIPPPPLNGRRKL